MAIFNSYVCLPEGELLNQANRGSPATADVIFFSGNSPIGKATISGWWFGT